MRVMGSPDPYGKQIDGMGAATSSTSKTVILSRSARSGHDVDYLFGQVAIDRPYVDWCGNCGNLSAAVGPFAITHGLVDPARVPRDGICDRVRLAGQHRKDRPTSKTIVAHVPVSGGEVQETGDFELDGVTFPAAEVALEFMDPAARGRAGRHMFPAGGRPGSTGRRHVQGDVDQRRHSDHLRECSRHGYTGTELQDAINGDARRRWNASRRSAHRAR